jgi:NhaP-type Na+/H+ or K+/H+ antiporter
LLCSSDLIAAISMISYTSQPKLFSIIYGEGVFNDIVSIILFRTVSQFDANYVFTSSKPFEIIATFLLLAVYSTSIGVIVGMLSSLLFKYFRFFTHSAITESSVIYIIAMLSYFAAEFWELSGLISLITCGVVMGHYTWYNLSP